MFKEEWNSYILLMKVFADPINPWKVDSKFQISKRLRNGAFSSSDDMLDFCKLLSQFCVTCHVKWITCSLC